MYLMVINGSPRTAAKSNTETIINAFIKGFSAEGNTASVYHISDRREWADIRAAFAENEHVLFALPLYVENVSGLMLEFLESLPKKATPGTKLSFILQSGFPEACQRRCGETYLEKLPAMLGCEFAGTLSRGDLFGVRLVGDKMAANMLEPFEAMGHEFAKRGDFLFDAALEFTGPETLPDDALKGFRLVGRHMQKLMMNMIAKKMGCKKKLDARPY